MLSTGHGDYRHITEEEFLPEVTGSRLVMVHFYHDGFERCRIVDKHLAPLAKKYFGTKFLKVHAPVSLFVFPHSFLGSRLGVCGRRRTLRRAAAGSRKRTNRPDAGAHTEKTDCCRR